MQNFTAYELSVLFSIKLLNLYCDKLAKLVFIMSAKNK